MLAVPRATERALDLMSGFTAGVMLAATSFSLLIPALERGTIIEVVAGLGLGGGCFALLDEVIPHVHLRFAERGHPLPSQESRRSTLLLSALTLHNIPEGMAVGLAFAAGGKDLGIPLALAIGVQNIPEGFAAAAPLPRMGSTTRFAALVAAATGAVEPPAAIISFVLFDAAEAVLPLGLAFAAGAMLYVVVDELIPESHARGNERLASMGFLAGFALMLTLDNLFG